jgi:hypothetical protein
MEMFWISKRELVVLVFIFGEFSPHGDPQKNPLPLFVKQCAKVARKVLRIFFLKPPKLDNSSSRSAKYSRILKIFYFHLWSTTKFGYFASLAKSQNSEKNSLVSAMDLVFFSPLELDFGDCKEF